MNKPHLKIYNGQIITPYRIISQGTVVVKGETIIEVREEDIDVPDAIEIDALRPFPSKTNSQYVN